MKPLAQWTEEFSDVLREKFGLLHRGEVAALGHGSPPLDVVAALCKRARRNWNLFGVATLSSNTLGQQRLKRWEYLYIKL